MGVFLLFFFWSWKVTLANKHLFLFSRLAVNDDAVFWLERPSESERLSQTFTDGSTEDWQLPWPKDHWGAPCERPCATVGQHSRAGRVVHYGKWVCGILWVAFPAPMYIVLFYTISLLWECTVTNSSEQISWSKQISVWTVLLTIQWVVVCLVRIQSIS